MKLRKGLSLTLVFSLFISCIPVYAGKEAQRVTLPRPWFGKPSLWRDWYTWRNDLPGFLKNPNTGRSILYPEEEVSSGEKFLAERFEFILRNNFSRRRLVEMVASNSLPALSFDRLKFAFYTRMPIPALAADIAVGAVDSALAGKSTEKIVERMIIGRATRTLTKIALVYMLGKVGAKAGAHLKMPENKLAAGAIWVASIPLYWVFEDIKNLAADTFVNVVGAPFISARQKINHLRNHAIWEHNKKIFEKHFTCQLLCDGSNYIDLTEKGKKLYNQLKSDPSNESLIQEFSDTMKKLGSGKYCWALRVDSDPEKRAQDITNTKTGLKNDTCPACWKLMQEGKLDEVCCIGRYSF